MPVRKKDTQHAVQLLQEYRHKLHSTEDVPLLTSIDRVIHIFQSNLFNALLDIQEYYEVTIEDENRLNTSQLGYAQENHRSRSGHSSSKGGSVSASDSSRSPCPPLKSAKTPANHVNEGATTLQNNQPIISPTTYQPPNFPRAPSANREQKLAAPGQKELVLDRGPSGFGFSIAGGIDNPHVSGDPSIFVTRLTQGGVAETQGHLRVGDILLAVNGVSLVNVPHSTAVEALKKAGEQLRLLIHSKTIEEIAQLTDHNNQVDNNQDDASSGRSESASSESSDNEDDKEDQPQQPPHQKQLLHIDLTKGPRGLGFSIAGGQNNEHIKGDPSIFITKVIDGGIAQQDGRISVGDRLLRVNSTLLENVTHETAVQALRNTGQTVQLLILKSSPEELANYQRHVENAKAESGTIRRALLNKRVGGLGFNIIGGENNEGIFISQLQPGGQAESLGILRVGDKILSVNGVEFVNESHESAVSTLKSLRDNVELMVKYMPDEFRRIQSESPIGNQQNGGPSTTNLSPIVKTAQTVSNRRTSDPQVHKSGPPTVPPNKPSTNQKMNQRPPQSNSSQTPTNETQPANQNHSKLVVTGSRATLPVTIAQRQSLYVRALFDYDPSKDSGLPNKGLAFSFGDILDVTNPHDEEWWQARHFSETGNNPVGIIPSKRRVERRERARLKKVIFTGPLVAEERGKRPVRQRQFHSTSEDNSNEEKSEDTILSYEIVKQQIIDYAQPVVILGAIKEKLNDLLLFDFPNHFCGCVPHTTRPKRDGEEDGQDYHFVSSREKMEADMEAGCFIEAGQYQGNLYGTSLQSVQSVAHTGRHCVLDVSGNAIKRLRSSGLETIAILIRAYSPEHIRYLNPRLSEEQAFVAYDRTVRLEAEFGSYFTAIVSGDSAEEIYDKVKTIIENNSGSTIWVATGTPFNY